MSTLLFVVGIALLAWGSYQFGVARGSVTMFPPLVIEPDNTYVIKVDRQLTMEMAARIKEAFIRESGGARVIVLDQGFDIVRDLDGAS